MKISQPLIVAAVLVVLVGCTTQPGGSSSVTGRPSGGLEPSPSVSSSAGPLPATALFRITSVIRSKTTGATARLVETVFAPSAGDGTETQQMSTAHCGDSGWTAQYSKPQWLAVTVTSEVLSGSWPKALVGVNATGMYAFPAWSGAVGPFQASCASGLVAIPGQGRAVIPIDPNVPVDAARSWGMWRYGFQWDVDGGAGPSDQPFDFTGCKLERGPGADASSGVSGWDAGHPLSIGPGYSPQCLWGPLS